MSALSPLITTIPWGSARIHLWYVLVRSQCLAFKIDFVLHRLNKLAFFKSWKTKIFCFQIHGCMVNVYTRKGLCLIILWPACLVSSSSPETIATEVIFSTFLVSKIYEYMVGCLLCSLARFIRVLYSTINAKTIIRTSRLRTEWTHHCCVSSLWKL